MGLSMLLRRVALARMPQQQPAGLTGEHWLAFLDSHSGGTPFSSGIGKVLACAPYTPDVDFDRSSLLLLAEEWIRENT